MRSFACLSVGVLLFQLIGSSFVNGQWGDDDDFDFDFGSSPPSSSNLPNGPISFNRFDNNPPGFRRPSDDDDDDDDEYDPMMYAPAPTARRPPSAPPAWSTGYVDNNPPYVTNGPGRGRMTTTPEQDDDDEDEGDEELASMIGTGGTDCGNPIMVSGATQMAFSASDSPVGIPFVYYSCLSGKMIGSEVSVCLPNNTWSTPPRCPTPIFSTTGRTQPGQRPGQGQTTTSTTAARTTTTRQAQSKCPVSPTVNTDDCDDIVSKFSYNRNTDKCVGITVCDNTPIRNANNNIFNSRADCLAACSPSATPTIQPTTTTTTTTTTQQPEPSLAGNDGEASEGQRAGGSRGPSCIAGADKTRHSSCLGNTDNTKQTIQFSISEVLDAHNVWRRFVNPRAANMTTLRWDHDLAITAERWAAQCPTQSEEDPESRAVPRIAPYIGQNLCFSQGRSAKSWKDCVNEWAAQRTNWDYDQGAKDGNGDNVKNYVQLIWGKTKFVGCGKVQCINSRFDYTMVCNYSGGPRVTPATPNPYATPYPKFQQPPASRG